MEEKNTTGYDPTESEIGDLDKDMAYVYEAENCLLRKLFGFIPEVPGKYQIERKVYIKALDEVQVEFKLYEGNPRLVLFVLEQLSRSPQIIDTKKSRKKAKR